MASTAAPSRTEMSTWRRTPGGRWSVILAGAGLVLTWLWGPEGLFTDASWVGYAVCHQIPERSYWAWGRPLPLCARCTGQYLGALVVLAYLVWTGRLRAAGWPPGTVMIGLGGFFLLWAFDGTNSYLALLGLPHLYEPRNLFRLITGSLQGVTLISVFWPLFVRGTWEQPRDERILTSWRDLGRVLPGVALVIVLVHFGGDRTRHALGLVSALGVLVLLSLVNSLLVRLMVRRGGRAPARLEVGAYLAAGLLLGLLEIGGMDALRASVVSAVGAF